MLGKDDNKDAKSRDIHATVNNNNAGEGGGRTGRGGETRDRHGSRERGEAGTEDREEREEMSVSDMRQEMQRLVVWTNAQQKPISFPLWYLRLKNRDVLAQLGTFVLTTIIVLLRTLILAREM